MLLANGRRMLLLLVIVVVMVVLLLRHGLCVVCLGRPSRIKGSGAMGSNAKAPAVCVVVVSEGGAYVGLIF